MGLLESMENYQEYIISPSGKKYTNEKNLPLLSVYTLIHLSETGYSGTGPTPGCISVTTLIAAPKKYLYALKYPDLEEIVDVSAIASSAKGTNLHNSFERAIAWWKELDPTIESETRLEREFEGYTIDGEYDFFQDNKVKDLKHVSNYSLSALIEEMEAIKAEGLLEGVYNITTAMEKYPHYFKYILQLSLYRWLRDIETDSTDGAIIFSLNNGGGFKGLPVDTEVTLPLIVGEKLETWIRDRLNLIKTHISNDTLPDCTDNERILKKGTWKLTRYSQKTGKYRTVNGTTSDTEAGFNNLIAGKTKPGDIIAETEPEYLACSWCKFKNICKQYAET